MIVKPYVTATYRTRYVQESAGVESRLTYTAPWTGTVGVRLGQETW
jgi:amino acid permease